MLLIISDRKKNWRKKDLFYVINLFVLECIIVLLFFFFIIVLIVFGYVFIKWIKELVLVWYGVISIFVVIVVVVYFWYCNKIGKVIFINL